MGAETLSDSSLHTSGPTNVKSRTYLISRSTDPCTLISTLPLISYSLDTTVKCPLQLIGVQFALFDVHTWDVASAQLCTRHGNVCDSGVTHHKVVDCMMSCFATGQLGCHPLTWPQDQV